MNIFKITLPTPYPVGDVNVYLVKGEALTLFDAGPKTQEAYEALKWGIHQAGFDMKDIEQVVLTHHHPDHAGWQDAFTNAAKLGHEYVDHWLCQTEEFLTYRNNFYRKHLKLQDVPDEFIEKIVETRGELELFGTDPLTQYMKDGDEVPGHPGLKAYYTPGHAQSHLIFVEEKTKEVIGGDLLLDTVSSNPLVEPPVDLSYNRPKSLIQYHDSLTILHELNVAKVYSGHGNEVINVNELIASRIKKDKYRANQVLEFITGPKTVLELTKDVYPQIYMKQLGLTLSKTLGYLDSLERDGLVKVTEADGVNLYERI